LLNLKASHWQDYFYFISTGKPGFCLACRAMRTEKKCQITFFSGRLSAKRKPWAAGNTIFGARLMSSNLMIPCGVFINLSLDSAARLWVGLAPGIMYSARLITSFIQILFRWYWISCGREALPAINGQSANFNK